MGRYANKATRRLQRDWDEVKKNPLSSVSAMPVGDDGAMFNWHANIRGAPGSDLQDFVMHLTLKFDEDYPRRPPVVKMETPGLSHPNVFGDCICLDMLEQGEWAYAEERAVPYTGWTSAYSVLSILLQLQSFFTEFGEHSPRRPNRKFRCLKCGHDDVAGVVNPPFPLEFCKLPSKFESSWRKQDKKEKSPSSGDDASTVLPTADDGSNCSVAALSWIDLEDGLKVQNLNLTKFLREKYQACEKLLLTYLVGYRGTVKSCQPFGYFVDLGGPTNGLLHRSNCRGDNEFSPGEKVTVFVISMENRQKVSLTDNPWVTVKRTSEDFDWLIRQPSPVALKCVVRGANRSGVFVDIGAGRGGPEGFITPDRTDAHEKEQMNILYPQGEVLTVAILKKEEGDAPRYLLNGKQLVFRPTREVVTDVTDVEVTPSCFGIQHLPDVILRRAFGYLPLGDFFSLSKVSRRFQLLGDETRCDVYERDCLQCFYSKVKLDARELPAELKVDSQNIILGVGLSVTERHPKSNTVKSVISAFDLLSFDAFAMEGVRTSVWKEKFTYFIPLVVNRRHWKRAKPVCEEALRMMNEEEVFTPATALQILPLLMNSTVVAMMKGDVHQSQKALWGYCGFHHLLLQFCQDYPQLQKDVDNRISQFILHEEYRVKKQTPDIGHFLCWLSVSSYSWEDVCVRVLEESFDRHILWLLRRNPELCDPTKDRLDGRSDRAGHHFKSARVGLKVLLFGVWFLENVARLPHSHVYPQGLTAHCTKAECSLDRYNRTRGVPLQFQIDELQQACSRIYRLSNWQDFFVWAHASIPSKRFLDRWLRRCVLNSLRKTYHYAGCFERQINRRQEAKEERLREKKATQGAAGYDDDWTVNTKKKVSKEDKEERDYWRWRSEFLHPKEEN